MKSKIELSELIELIELANNPNTIHLADKLLSEKITSIKALKQLKNGEQI